MKMLKKESRVIASLIFVTLSCYSFFSVTAITASDVNKNLSINLKAKSIVLGPEIRLRDVGTIIIPDTKKKAEIAQIIIGKAPPPGESSEISLNYIKRRLKVSGFEDYVSIIKGPRIIRIVTAHVEIDKAFLKQEFASINPENSRREEG